MSSTKLAVIHGPFSERGGGRASQPQAEREGGGREEGGGLILAEDPTKELEEGGKSKGKEIERERETSHFCQKSSLLTSYLLVTGRRESGPKTTLSFFIDRNSLLLFAYAKAKLWHSD